MADPRPFYRTLRDHHPVYYIEDLDTFALSRFDDIWDVLAINDGTFVASEGTLPSAAVLATATTDPSPTRRCIRCRSTPTSTLRSTTTSGAAPRASSGRNRRDTAGPHSRAGQPAPRRAAAAGGFDLTQEYGGIVAASIVCELLGLPTDLAAAGPGGGQRRQPCRAWQRRRGGQRPARLSRLPDPGGRRRPRRRARRTTADRREPAGLPAARRVTPDRRRGGGPDARRLHRRHRDGAQDRRAWAVGAEPAPRPAGCRPRRPGRQRRRRARGDHPVLRTRAVVRPNRSASLHHSRHRPSSPASGSSACSPRPTATIGSIPIRRRSSGTGPSSGRWPSVAANTSAWATTSPAWKSGCCCRSGCAGSRTTASRKRRPAARRPASNGAGTTSRSKCDVDPMDLGSCTAGSASRCAA